MQEEARRAARRPNPPFRLCYANTRERAGTALALALSMTLLPPKLSRYRAVAQLLLKYGRSSLVTDQDDFVATLTADDDAAVDCSDPAPDELACDLEKLGPTFVKLGQLLSTRADLLPLAYLHALSRLQDSVQPFPFEEVQKIVEEELGVKISKAFSAFDEEPEAAASLGQVHRAALRDGRLVAVKVQRPGIIEQVAGDLETLKNDDARRDELPYSRLSRSGDAAVPAGGNRRPLAGVPDPDPRSRPEASAVGSLAG